MHSLTFSRTACSVTFVFAATLLYAMHGSDAAKPKPGVKLVASRLMSGKALLTQYRCVGCHGSNLLGRAGFSPSIRRTGALHDYTQAQFVTLMHTGIKNDGSRLRPPMPVYAKMPIKLAVSIFAYLYSIK